MMKSLKLAVFLCISTCVAAWIGSSTVQTRAAQEEWPSVRLYAQPGQNTGRAVGPSSATSPNFPSDPESTCSPLGWFPDEIGLKDHSIFWYDGYYYLASIYQNKEDRFAYARSTDLCEWETLAPILNLDEAQIADEVLIWAPFVFVENGTYYMYYTGINPSFTQRILLATSTDPANPDSWQAQSVIFQPTHSSIAWENGSWADCRDPMVIKVGSLYYLYYTANTSEGGVIGLASATAPQGPWMDWGPIVTPVAGRNLESPAVVQYGNAYYLFYNETSKNERYRIGSTPAGPWLDPVDIQPGWAHEVWLDQEGVWYTSYLTTQTVTISPLTWDNFYWPARPWIGASVHHTLLPLIIHEISDSASE